MSVAKKVISLKLSEKGIDQAIKEIKAYKQQMLDKMDEFRQRLADEIAKEAEIGFNASTVDDIVKGSASPHKAEVSVSVADNGNVSVVVANGEDAVWCEFGAGVYHNGSAGSSPNPFGAQNGLTIGSYGQGKGAQTAWGYYDENGEVVITRGTPATMPMYRACVSVASRAINIAREVFG
jgi:hypothetical protein